MAIDDNSRQARYAKEADQSARQANQDFDRAIDRCVYGRFAPAMPFLRWSSALAGLAWCLARLVPTMTVADWPILALLLPPALIIVGVTAHAIPDLVLAPLVTLLSRQR